MLLPKTGKINGTLTEALQNVLSGPRIDFGLLRVVSAGKSGVIGICREYLTGAQITGSDEVGLSALQTLCRTERGMYTIVPTCEVADFVAVNQELHIPINEMIEELKKPQPLPQTMSQSQRAIPDPQAVSRAQPAMADQQAISRSQASMPDPQAVSISQPVMPDPQTLSQPQKAIPPMVALGGSSVPPPPAHFGVVQRVATAVGNALSGRYKAAQADPQPADDDGLMYDPAAIGKGTNVLNQVLNHAKQTFGRLKSVRAREEENATPPLEYQPEPLTQRSSLNNLMPAAPRQPAPTPQQPKQPVESSFNIAPPHDPRGDVFQPVEFSRDALQHTMPPTPPRIEPMPQIQSEPAAPKENLSDSTIVRAAQLFHQQVDHIARKKKNQDLREKEGGAMRQDRREAANNAPPGPSAWSKLFFWRRGDE